MHEKRLSITSRSIVVKFNKIKAKHKYSEINLTKDIIIIFNSSVASYLIHSEYMKKHQYIKRSMKKIWIIQVGTFTILVKARVSFYLYKFNPY